MGAPSVLHLDMEGLDGGAAMLTAMVRSVTGVGARGWWARIAPFAWVLALAGVGATAVHAQVTAEDEPLAFLEPLIGTWLPDPAWLVENPGMDEMIPLALEWGATRHSIRYRAGLRREGRLYTDGLIVWNPATGVAELLASQGEDGLLFRGYYEAVDSTTIRRVYEVFYPDGQSRDFRETFFLLGPDMLDWYTEWAPEGEWVPRRGDPVPEFRAIRAPAGSGSLDALAPFVGSWLEVPEDETRADAATRWVLEWGTDRRWISVVQQESASGTWVSRGAGIVGFDPSDRTIRSWEASAAGQTARVLWRIDADGSLRRSGRTFPDTGIFTDWIERLTLDPGGRCLTWAPVTEGEPSPRPSTRSRRFCSSR